MAQSALKYDEFDQMDQVPIPAGGIATFLTAETGSWADDDEVMPKKGIAQVHQIADKLAEYGRNEDEYMVHAAEGETVIPMEVFDKNPTLRNKLFAEMRLMGIEPERYVVGNELNSINPVTGQPEFFLKKLFKGLKKIVKAVLPVVATIALTIATGNPALASAIVQGAQTAIQGGSLKDTLKAAAIGGISGAVAGKLGTKYDLSSAKQAMVNSAINTTLHGGKPKDILKNAALAAVSAKGFEAFQNRGATPTPEMTPTQPVQGDPSLASQDLFASAITPADAANVSIDAPVKFETTIDPNIDPNIDLASAATEVAPIDATTPTTLSDVPVRTTGMDMPYSADNPMGYGAPTVQEMSSSLPAALRPDYVASDVLGNASTGFQAATPEQLAYQNSLTQAATPEQLAYQNAVATQTSAPAASASGDPALDARFNEIINREITVPDYDISNMSSEQMNLLGDGTETPRVGVEPAQADAAAMPATEQAAVDAAKAPGVIDSLKTAFSPKTEGFGTRFEALGDVFLPKMDTDALRKYYSTQYPNEPLKVNALIDDAVKRNGPNFIRKFGPAAAATMMVSALSKPEDVELMDINDLPTGQSLIDADPSRYRIYGDDFRYQQPKFTVQNVAGQYFQPTPVATAADGGIMNVSDFPRRNGGIAGPGTETSDDIPAMLSDGEFVFTAQAVRGAGKGSREDGMKNMYQMMRQFEARA